jgi:hypothetical protein
MLYPRSYAIGASIVAQLRFALRHEPLDLGVLAGAMRAMPATDLEDWVRAEPTGAFSRRAWFLYETLTRRTLDVDDARSGNYVDALDPSKHVAAEPRRSQRHRVSDNLLGGPGLCPTVRRTARLEQQMSLRIDDEAAALIRSYDSATLARAVHYLYTKETRSSFAIEGESPTAKRSERFVGALKGASAFDPTSKAALVRLQGDIVDPRYAATDWRSYQNFVGQALGDHREEVHFICPRPKDVPDLMAAWMALTQSVTARGVDPVVAAAVSAFAFIFVHPFEDGNGRIHRFLIHSILAKRGYSPPEVIFPISAAILRDRRAYDAVLEGFSKPLLDLIDWRWSNDRSVVVSGATDHLYRYFDATSFAEYLYDRVADTVRKDLREELGYVAVFDRAFETVREHVDMPDRRVTLFVRLCMQNGGQLAVSKRKLFAELSNAEIAVLEAEVQAALRSEAEEHDE